MRSFCGGNEGCLAIAKYFDDFFFLAPLHLFASDFARIWYVPSLRFTFDKDLSRAGYS